MCDPPWDPVTPPTVPTIPTHPTTPEPECHDDTECNEDMDVICKPDYSNCFYCDGHECKPGCATTANCGGEPAVCTGAHLCAVNGPPLVVGITVRTEACTQCGTD